MVAAIGVAFVVGLLATVALVAATNREGLEGRARRSTQALHIADAGLAEALFRLERFENRPPFDTATATGGSFDFRDAGSGWTFHVEMERPEPEARPYRWIITSTGSAGGQVRRKIRAEVDAYNIWDFEFSGASTSGGNYVTGNVNIHGPFYVRGDFLVGGNMEYEIGPLYVKGDPAQPPSTEAARQGARMSGSLVIQGSAVVGDPSPPQVACEGPGYYVEKGPIDAFIDSGVYGATDTNFYTRTLTYGPNILDLTLPVVDDAMMRAYYLGADFNTDRTEGVPTPSGFPGADNSMNASVRWPTGSDPGLILDPSGPPFRYEYPYRDRQGNQSTGVFSFDPWVTDRGGPVPGALLHVDGIVFVDGPLYIGAPGGGGSAAPIYYEGWGTLVVRGPVQINAPFRPARMDTFPEVNVVGLVSDYVPTGTRDRPSIDLALPSSSGGSCDEPAVAGAFFGKGRIDVSQSLVFRGSLISGMLLFGSTAGSGQPPSLWTQPSLSENLPPGLPGGGRTVQVIGWHELPVD